LFLICAGHTGNFVICLVRILVHKQFVCRASSPIYFIINLFFNIAGHTDKKLQLLSLLKTIAKQGFMHILLLQTTVGVAAMLIAAAASHVAAAQTNVVNACCCCYPSNCWRFLTNCCSYCCLVAVAIVNIAVALHIVADATLANVAAVN